MTTDRTPERRTPTSTRSVLVVAIIVSVLALLPVLGRVAFEGRAEILAADRAHASGSTVDEIVHLGRAARWRMPLARHDDDAIARLMALADSAETSGERELALSAYREARSAIVGTRGLRLPHQQQFHAANEAIARLMAEQERDFGRLRGDGDVEAALAEKRAWHLERLEAVPGPDPIGSSLAALCFIGFVITAVGFVMRGLDVHGRVRPKVAVRWGGACLVLMIAWMVLMRWPELL